MIIPESKRLRVQITSDGHDQRIIIDGHDVSSGVTAATLKVNAGSLPVLELDVLLYQDGAIADIDEVRAIVPPETATVLERLGWTPPKQQHT